MAGLSLAAVGRKTTLTCGSGVCVVCGAERGLPRSPDVRVASFGGELSAVGLPKNPPCAPRVGAKGLSNKLLGEAWVGALSCSPKSPPPVVGCGGVDTVPRLGAGDSPGLPNREGVVRGVDGALKRGVFAGPDVSFVDSVPRENGCIFDKSSFFCESGVFH